MFTLIFSFYLKMNLWALLKIARTSKRSYEICFFFKWRYGSSAVLLLLVFLMRFVDSTSRILTKSSQSPCCPLGPSDSKKPPAALSSDKNWDWEWCLINASKIQPNNRILENITVFNWIPACSLILRPRPCSKTTHVSEDGSETLKGGDSLCPGSRAARSQASTWALPGHWV